MAHDPPRDHTIQRVDQYWDGTGLWPIAKRLEKGRFVWPPIIDDSVALTPGQLALLVEAMDWRRTVAPPLPPQPMLL
jgi:transposase